MSDLTYSNVISSINTQTCKKCKLCIEICPCKVMGEMPDKTIAIIPEKEAICVKCGQCMAICETKSVQINGLSYETDIIELSENTIKHSEFINFLSHRRSIRNFKNKEIPDEIIEELLQSIYLTPYGSSPEKMHITIVNNRNTIEAALPFIEQFLDNVVKWVESPFFSKIIRFKKGKETFNTLKNHLYPKAKIGHYKLKNGDRITRGAPALIIFHADKEAEEHTNNSLIQATYLMLAAHAMGLGATMIGIVPAAINKVKEIRQLFKIPNNHEAIISIIIGYPKYKFKRGIIRKEQKINWV